MNPRMIELALARGRLTVESEALRQRLAAAAVLWRPACGGIDRLRQGVDWLRTHPALFVAVAVAFLVARPRAVLSLAGRGWIVWRLLRSLRAGRNWLAAIGVDLGRRKNAAASASGDRGKR